MAFSFSQLSEILLQLQEQNSTIDGLTGRDLLEDHQKKTKVFLTYVPGKGAGLLISPTAKDIRSLRQVSLRGLEVRNLKASINGSDELEHLGILCHTDGLSGYGQPFLRFVEDLVLAFENSNSVSEVEIVRWTLNKWRLFWTPVDTEVTEEWVKGLWGELFVLRKFIQSGATRAVAYWTGPEGMDHDFQGAGVGIEVKTTETAPPILSVNNLRQLDPSLFRDLFVIVCLISKTITGGETLDRIIADIVSSITNDQDLVDIFWRKLGSAGYRPQHQSHYDAWQFSIVNEPLWYRVNNDFPRITGESFKGPLDARIREIRYRVELTNVPPEKDKDIQQKILSNLMGGVSP